MADFRPKTDYTAEQIARVNWIWDSGLTADYTDDEISVAARVATAHYLASIDESLKRLVNMANSLGLDGIHEVIQVMRREVREKEENRKQAEAEKKHDDQIRTMARNRARRLKRQRAARLKNKSHTKGKGK